MNYVCDCIKRNESKMPSKETLKQCFLANPDGCGFMYFYARLKELDEQIGLKKRAIVFHFRISTSGLIDEGNCHPYPICNNIRVMRSTYLKCKDVAFCHNGIISDYIPKSKLINDTQCFGIHVLDKFYELNHEFYKDKDICRMLKLLCKSKLCFLNGEGEIYYIGDFVNIKGNLCSNNYFTYYTKRRTSLNYLCY